MRARGTLAALAILAVAALTGVTFSAFSSETRNQGSSFATASSFFTCPASMRAAYLHGFESGRRSAGGTGGNLVIFNPGTVDAAVKRTGDYSMKVAPSNSSVYGSWTNSNLTLNTQVARFAIHLDALPSGNVNQLFGMSAGTFVGLSLRYTAATKKLSLAIKPTSAATPTVVTSDVVLQAARWYVLDVRYRTGAPTHIADWRIDGSPQPTASVAGSGLPTYTTYFGTAPTVPDTYTAHYDDVLISNDSTVYPLGDGRVHAVRPDGMGTSAGPAGVITNNDGTNLDATSWTRLDEVPMLPITDFVQQTAVNTSAYAEVTFGNTTHTCIRAAHGFYTTHSAATTSSNFVRVTVRDGTTESVLLAGSSLANNTNPRDGGAPLTSAAGWSQSAINGLVLRFGEASSVNGEFPKLDGAMIEYEVPQ